MLTGESRAVMRSDFADASAQDRKKYNGNRSNRDTRCSCNDDSIRGDGEFIGCPHNLARTCELEISKIFEGENISLPLSLFLRYCIAFDSLIENLIRPSLPKDATDCSRGSPFNPFGTHVQRVLGSECEKIRPAWSWLEFVHFEAIRQRVDESGAENEGRKVSPGFNATLEKKRTATWAEGRPARSWPD